MERILTEEARIEKLKDILKGTPEEGYGLKIKYKGSMKACKAYKIPLDCLIYNKYNGRIASRVQTYETQYRSLNPEHAEDFEIIERFLWESDETSNQTTMEDLIKFGQRVAGVVTVDGRIADGNRRASLLNKIWKEREKYDKYGDLSNCKYFIGVILEDKLTDKEMLELELNIQLADDKVGYNAIEKYLKCDQLRKSGFSIDEIKEMMRYNKVKEVEEALKIKKLMDEFLDYIGYAGIYTRLDKTEDIFIGLQATLNKYENGTLTRDFDWNPSEMDVNDLKIASFNYIRAEVDNEKQYRYITGAKRNESFFATERVWQNYMEITAAKIDEANIAEKSLDQLRRENPGSNVSALIKSRDDEWRKNVRNKIKEGFGTSLSMVEAKEEKDEPMMLLKKALNNVEAINPDSPALLTEEIGEILQKLNQEIYELKKINKKGMRNV